MAESTYHEVKFTDKDIVNPDDFCPAGEDNAHRRPSGTRPWLIHDHGFVVCVVFASNMQDALDEAVDNHKLDAFLIDEEYNTPGTKGRPASDYPTIGTENEEGITRLGNASEPFDIESLSVIELPNPKFSFCAMFNASQTK